MFRRFRAFADHFFSKAVDGLDASLHRVECDSSRDALRTSALAEYGKFGDGPVPPAAIIPPAPRRTAAEERRRIDDMPIP